MLIYKSNDYSYCITDMAINNIHSESYSVIDIEATGLDYNKEYIIQLAAVKYKFNNDLKSVTLKSFNEFVKPPISIPDKIVRLTNIDNNKVKNASDIRTVLYKFKNFIEDDILVAQCGFEFDFPLLDYECQRNKVACFDNRRIDTKVLFANIATEKRETFSTDYLIRHYLIDTTDLKRHDALNDSKIISRILNAIMCEYWEKSIYHLEIDKELKIQKFIPFVIE